MRSLTGFIPARGGSKGVIRKNLRLVAGKPLVQHAIELAFTVCDSAIVSTDDADIAAVARLCGAGVVERDDCLASDEATVDEVVDEFRTNHKGPLLVIQPTVIGVDPMELQQFVGGWERNRLRFMAVSAPHIFWDDGKMVVPRNNRQAIEGLDAEVGVRLYPAEVEFQEPEVWLHSGPVVDVDTPEDLLTARHLLERKRILFRVLVNDQVGHGHLRRVLSLAEELQHHKISIQLATGSDGHATDLIPAQWLSTELKMPDVHVIDALDTVTRHWDMGVPRVHFEDKGPGTRGAAAVINSLYPTSGDLGGPDWAIIRPEFFSVPKEPGEGVLISFGGTDPAHLTETLAKQLVSLEPRIVPPPGRTIDWNILGGRANIIEDASVAEEISRARVVVTGGGRTVYESLFCNRPVVSVCQNPRELTHTHLDPGFGVFKAGLAGLGGEGQGALATISLMSDERMWGEFRDRTVGVVDGLGVRRCGTLIEDVAGGLRK